MSADEQRTKKALLKLDREEAGQRLALLKHEARAIAEALESISKELRDHPENIELHDEGLVLADYKGLGTLLRDIKTTIAEIQDLESTLESGKIVE